LGIPFDAWNYFVPKDNPMTQAKVELGKELFFDKSLSADGTVSCSSCHDPARAFTDGKKVAEGIGGRKGGRNVPTLLNAMFNADQFWDGRVETLEEQVRQPLVNPDEMGNSSLDEVVRKVQQNSGYDAKFKAAFGEPATIGEIGKAIAVFERTLVSGNSAVDRYLAGDRAAMSESARRGMGLFAGRARCTVCHSFVAAFAPTQSFPFFTDQMYHNTGVAANDPGYSALAQRAAELAKHRPSRQQLDQLAKEPGALALGRFLVTGNTLDIGAFKTPSLRNVDLTGPYFHDGSVNSLAEVVKFYLKGGNRNPNIDWELTPVNLTEQDQSDLVEFLKSLSGVENVREVKSSE
ncbi:MAG: cytochrome-c peroxidase, partial [Blastocatellia bacterium]